MKNVLKATLDTLSLGAVARRLRDHVRYRIDRNTRSRNARFIRNPAPDGLPMPSPELVYLVTGQFDVEAFYHNGVLGAECIRGILRKGGLEIQCMERILDFGCGCGRLMRQWKGLDGQRLCGVDCNPRLVHWCRKNLRFAEFAVNESACCLNFDDGAFDFIYSISVFTHLTEESQRFWMDELIRVLRPGGHLLITVHGTTRLGELAPEQLLAFESGKVVVVGSKYCGTNFCGTFHPQAYVRNVLCKGLEFVTFEPGGAEDANQDVFLLRKPSGNWRVAH